MPGRGWRRAIAAFVATLAALVLMVGVLFLYDYATATVLAAPIWAEYVPGHGAPPRRRPAHG